MLRQSLALMLASILGAPLPAAELPVRKVVLYKHGIGFFERSGRVPAGEAARLDFKAAEMNDVLKSLTIEERGGGKVVGVRYDSSEPVDRKLGQFPFTLGGPLPLAAILDQFKGSRMELRFPAGPLEGTIVSARTITASERQPERQEVILLLDSGDLRTIDLSAASAIRLVDPKLQAQLQEYLAVMSQSRNREKRGVIIDSSEAGARDVIANYVIPTPSWKSSYRLVLDSGPEPLLEGWAIVDNTTGEDWNNISLALVSGLPVSFVTRLYEPRYVGRPEAELPEDRAQRPILHAGVVEEAKDLEGREKAVVGGIAGAPAAMPAPQSMVIAPLRAVGSVGGFRDVRKEMAATAEMDRLDFASSLAQTAAGRELGDLFEYRMDHAVTIRKNESALLPFLQQRINGRRLLIFSESYGSQHPLTAVEITNSSGKTLDGGAVTVLDSGAYAGESLMETVKAGDKRLISYAVDLGTRVTTAFDSQSNLLSEFRFRRGILTTRTALKEVKTFTIRNVDARAKTLIVETPVRPDYKLTGAKPVETTANTYRFEVKLGAGATEKFPVTEQRIIEQTVAVSSLTPDVLFSYVRNRDLDEAARKKLEPLAALKQQMASTDADLQAVEKQIQDLVEDQSRLRQNISSLNQVSGQQQRVQEYAQRLGAQEIELAGLRDRKAELEKRKRALERQIGNMMETLEI
ncbi:MAG: hypothetical protein HY236_13405 [Acidobacteria bacterium]|nr:hypothetical protein [Acidobacteriota bacterium]